MRRWLITPLIFVAVAERAAWEVRKLRAAGRMRRTERRMEALAGRWDQMPPVDGNDRDHRD